MMQRGGGATRCDADVAAEGTLEATSTESGESAESGDEAAPWEPLEEGRALVWETESGREGESGAQHDASFYGETAEVYFFF